MNTPPVIFVAIWTNIIVALAQNFNYRPVARRHPPPPTGIKGPHFGTRGPTFRVQSVKVKDAYIDDMFSLWDSNKQEINLFFVLPNSFHPTIRFTAEISENETTFLVITNYKGEKLKNEPILGIRTHYKPTTTHISTQVT